MHGYSSWQRIKLAIARKAATSKRTTDDLRLVLLHLAEITDDIPQTVAAVMGWSEEELPQTYGDSLEFVRERTASMNADQLGAMLMAWVIDSAPFPTSVEPAEVRAAKIDLAARYGVDVIEAGAESPTPAPAPAPAAEPEQKPATGPIKAKYRNPATGESWSGRGLQPKWIQVALADGKRLEDFLAVKPLTLADNDAPDDAGLAEADEQASSAEA